MSGVVLSYLRLRLEAELPAAGEERVGRGPRGVVLDLEFGHIVVSKKKSYRIS